ncbi:MAG: hypothetical protein COA82_03740 [Alkaliphilus sp.]|nr:MAG: hypothetical protein COA82_03740 [Alkaliphilus sp.]
MKKNRKKKGTMTVKYDYGGFGTVASAAGTVLGSTAYNQQGGMNTGANIGANALNYGAMGLKVGGPIGGIVGAVGGGIHGALQARKANRKHEENQRQNRMFMKRMKDDYSQAIVNDYPSQGVEGNQRFYKHGGMHGYRDGGTHAAGGDFATAFAAARKSGKSKFMFNGKEYDTRKKMSDTNSFQGGGIQVQGGELNPAASNAVVAEGNTHTEGGINAGNGMEVEDNEVIIDQGDHKVVFSDSLYDTTGNTFASTAEKLVKMKGKQEGNLKSTDKYARGTAEKTVSNMDARIALLTQEQLDQQVEKGISPYGEKTAKYGAVYTHGGIGDPTGDPVTEAMQLAASRRDVPVDPVTGLPITPNTGPVPLNFGAVGAAPRGGEGVNYGPDSQSRLERGVNAITPFLDNTVNAILTAKTPYTPAPTLRKSVPMKTRFNINPQLDAIDDSTGATRKAILQTSSNSAGAHGNIIAAHAANINAKNQLFGQKENSETSLINANRMNAQQVQHGNAALIDAKNMQDFQRQDSIQGRISKNVSNAVEDRQIQIQESNLRNRDAATLELLKLKYKESGVMTRGLDKAFEDFSMGRIDYNNFMRIRKEEELKDK